MCNDLISITIPTIGRFAHKPNMVMGNFVKEGLSGIYRKVGQSRLIGSNTTKREIINITYHEKPKYYIQ